MQANILAQLILVPISAGLALLAIPERFQRIARGLSFVVSLGAFIGAISVFNTMPGYWPGINTPVFSADILSSFIGIAIAFFALLVTVYSSKFIKSSVVRYYSLVLITLGAALGVAFANNLIVFIIFWGVLALLLYLLVNMQGTDGSARAAKKALIIIGGTDALLLFGVALLWSMTGSIYMDKMQVPLDGALSVIAFLSIMAASFAKAGAMPLHSWLPDVAECGPTPVSAYLPASLDKLLGIYLLARMALKMFIMNGAANFVLAFCGSVTIVIAVMLALVQHDMKRLLGYHAVSQVGYMVLGIGTGNPIGIAGGLFHMLNHTIYKSCLFLSGGNVEQKTGTADLEKLGGLGKYMPVTFACFLVAALSISGMPPFNGFVSKWMIYQGIIESAGAKNPLWIIWLTAAMFGSALTLASFMKLLHAIFLGRPAKDFSSVKEAPFSMTLPVVILASLCFIFGVFAFILPLRLFIAPSTGLAITYIGLWRPVVATVLIIIGIIAGFFIYFLLKPMTFRTVGPFMGGAEEDEIGRMSGTDFYDTIKNMKALKGMYNKEEEREFDPYAVARNAVLYFTGVFQRLHNGILPTYMVWCLLGMIGMFLILFLR